MTKIVLKFLLLLFVPFFTQARDTDSLRVLWVGNSYTYYNDMPSTVRQIAATQKVKLSCTRFLKGGERLSGHLKNQKLLDAIAAGGWDYVILQEQSSAPAMPTRQVAREVYPAARTLDSLVHVASPDARVIFYMTWGHKNGNRFPIPEYPPANSYGTMQERLITSYLEMAYDNDAWCAPVGMAWRRVRAERPDYVLYAQDCFHPGPLGSYLAANVIFTTIYGKPYQTDCTLDFPAEQAEYIQRVAQQTVLENLTLLNIKRSSELYGFMPALPQARVFSDLGRPPALPQAVLPDRMPALTARSAPASASSFRRSTRSAPLCAVTAP